MPRVAWKALQSSIMTSVRPARATMSRIAAAVFALRRVAWSWRCATSSELAAEGSASRNACTTDFKRSCGVGALVLSARHALRTAAEPPEAAS